jgi:Trk K+ transport system NAD-binding subunit
MSVLLVGATGELGAEVVARLVGQGDDVRVVEPDADEAAMFKELGAFVARGDPHDDDLLERAATNVRTVVAFATGSRATQVVDAVARVARTGSVDRLVLYASKGAPEAVRRLGGGALDFIVLTGPRGMRRRIGTADIAAAIDAADDLAGSHRLVLDLGDAGAWKVLGLEKP